MTENMFNKINNELLKNKDLFDINDYLNEIKDIYNLLDDYDRDKALHLYHKLINKYFIELDIIGKLNRTNKVVVHNQNEKDDLSLKDDLIYIANMMPSIAELKYIESHNK